jgi:hypothetical protein
MRLSVDFYLPYMGKDRGRTKPAKGSPLYGLPFSLIVMPGLDPGIHAAAPADEGVDGRIKSTTVRFSKTGCNRIA